MGSRREYVISSSDVSKGNIINFATLLEDKKILEIVEKECIFYYHKVCCFNYRRDFQSKLKSHMEPTDWHKVRSFHKKAYKILKTFIYDDIIHSEKVFMLNDLFMHYKALLTDLDPDNIFFVKITTVNILNQNYKKTGDIVVIQLSKTLNKKIIYKNTLDINVLASSSLLQDIAESGKLKKLAYEIRHKIVSLKKKKILGRLLQLQL